MQVNLKAHNSTELEFSTKLTLPQDVIENIHSISPPDNDGDSPFFYFYENHRSLAFVEKVDKKTLKSNIGFLYQTKRGRVPKRKLPQIPQLIELLTTIKQQFTFDCTVSFTFSRKLHAKPIIQLPQKYFELPNMPFDRIQGMHLVKLNGSETKYDVFLESPTQGVIVENIIYKYTTGIDNNLASKIFAEATDISDKFIYRE
jgi:hypothetical protein